MTTSDATPADAAPRRKRRRRSLLLIAMAGILGGLSVGFVDFANHVARATPPGDVRADGIVVLTGGSARIDEALQLLAEGRATRLLISGVNPLVTRAELAAAVAEPLRPMLDCCAELGREAEDTVGNAAEASAWAAERGLGSLIVVTSGYHMPRSMAELSKAMPGTQLIPFPVNNPDLHLRDWWRDREALSLLLREYGKLLLAEARRIIAPVRPANAATARG